MPGPRSAPNGDWSLTQREGDHGPNINTGKTALKRGFLKERKAVTDEANRIRRAMSDNVMRKIEN